MIKKEKVDEWRITKSYGKNLIKITNYMIDEKPVELEPFFEPVMQNKTDMVLEEYLNHFPIEKRESIVCDHEKISQNNPSMIDVGPFTVKTASLIDGDNAGVLMDIKRIDITDSFNQDIILLLGRAYMEDNSIPIELFFELFTTDVEIGSPVVVSVYPAIDKGYMSIGAITTLTFTNVRSLSISDMCKDPMERYEKSKFTSMYINGMCPMLLTSSGILVYTKDIYIPQREVSYEGDDILITNYIVEED